MDIDKLQSSSIAKSLSDPLTPPQQPPPDGPASDDLQQETGTSRNTRQEHSRSLTELMTPRLTRDHFHNRRLTLLRMSGKGQR